LCSVFQEFLSWLERWIGTEAYRKIPTLKTRHGSPLMNSFETAKMHFSGDEEDVEVTLPKECGINYDEAKNIDDKVLTIKRSICIQRTGRGPADPLSLQC
jgi:hypothetical protein